MTTTHGTVDYYRDRLSRWGDRDQLTSALGWIRATVETPDIPESEKLKQVRNVLEALEQVRGEGGTPEPDDLPLEPTSSVWEQRDTT